MQLWLRATPAERDKIRQWVQNNHPMRPHAQKTMPSASFLWSLPLFTFTMS